MRTLSGLDPHSEAGEGEGERMCISNKLSDATAAAGGPGAPH